MTSYLDDPRRLAALASYEITDMPPEAALDSLVELAAQFCDAPIALVTLVDEAKQFFVARHAFDGDPVAPLAVGFCPAVVTNRDPLVIPDTLKDEHHAVNLAARDGGVRFYAGVPLVDADQHTLGTLCVLDRKPRPEGLSETQMKVLGALAAQVVQQFELRRLLASRQRMVEQQLAVIRERDALARVQRAIASADGDIDVILSTLVEGALEAVPAAEGAVLELIDGDMLEYRMVAGALAEHKGLRIPLSGSLAGACALTERPMLVADVRADGRAIADLVEPLRLASAALAPVCHAREVLGVLKLQSSVAGAFGEDELQIVRLFAGTASAGLTEVRAAAAQIAAAESLEALNQVLAERVEKTSRERDLLWQLSSDLLVILAADGRYLDANPAWSTALGYESASLIGERHVDIVHPDDQARVETSLTDLAEDAAVRNVDARMRHANGSWRRYDWTCVLHEGRFYATGRDVTEGRRLEDQLRQSQKMEAVGQLTGGVAHDFNNLLTIIRSSVDLLRRPQTPPERRERYLDAVSETVDRAAKLTGQLLAFARRQALKPEVFDVFARMNAVAEMIDTVIGARISVHVSTDAEYSFVRADVGQFDTALVNMAVNARDAMDGEGVLRLVLHSGVTMPSIRGHASANGPFAAISIIDTGSGIDADQIEQIFEPFFTTKVVGKGTGLGLSQVFGFAKQSGGDVAVESGPGAGTTFTLYLPEVERPVLVDDGAASPPEALDAAGRCVLVVEDNLEVGRFSTELLGDLGFRTEWAKNAEEALERLGPDGAGFDIVFSDVVMPGMGGVALARGLKRQMPHLPIVLTSGYSHVLAEEGVSEFTLLRKPYSAEQLIAVMQSAIASSRT